MPRLPRLILLVFGVAGTATGVTAAVVGSTASGWIASLLPPVEIDAAAIGGAASTLGYGVLVLGLAQLALAVALRRRARWLVATAAALGGLLCATFLSLAAAAFTSAASADLPWLILVGAGLLVVAAGYAVAFVLLVRASTRVGRAGGAPR